MVKLRNSVDTDQEQRKRPPDPQDRVAKKSRKMEAPSPSPLRRSPRSLTQKSQSQNNMMSPLQDTALIATPTRKVKEVKTRSSSQRRTATPKRIPSPVPQEEIPPQETAAPEPIPNPSPPSFNDFYMSWQEMASTSEPSNPPPSLNDQCNMQDMPSTSMEPSNPSPQLNIECDIYYQDMPSTSTAEPSRDLLDRPKYRRFSDSEEPPSSHEKNICSCHEERFSFPDFIDHCREQQSQVNNLSSLENENDLTHVGGLMHAFRNIESEVCMQRPKSTRKMVLRTEKRIQLTFPDEPPDFDPNEIIFQPNLNHDQEIACEETDATYSPPLLVKVGKECPPSDLRGVEEIPEDMIHDVIISLEAINTDFHKMSLNVTNSFENDLPPHSTSQIIDPANPPEGLDTQNLPPCVVVIDRLPADVFSEKLAKYHLKEYEKIMGSCKKHKNNRQSLAVSSPTYKGSASQDKQKKTNKSKKTPTRSDQVRPRPSTSSSQNSLAQERKQRLNKRQTLASLPKFNLLDLPETPLANILRADKCPPKPMTMDMDSADDATRLEYEEELLHLMFEDYQVRTRADDFFA